MKLVVSPLRGGDRAESIVEEIPEVAAAHCYPVSRVGSPANEPAIAHAQLATHDGMAVEPLQSRGGEVVAHELQGIPSWIGRFVAGTIGVF